MLKIEAYTIDPESPHLEIIPATNERHWFAPHCYRCTPLKVANRAGWDLRVDEDIAVEWNGGSHRKDVEVLRSSGIAESAFGIGTFTLQVGYIWKLSPGWQLMVMPVPNGDLEDCEAMSAVMETEVLDYPWFLTMRMFKAGITRIKPGTRVARILPVRMSELGDSSLTIYGQETSDMKITRLGLTLARKEDIAKGRDWGKHYHGLSTLKGMTVSEPESDGVIQEPRKEVDMENLSKEDMVVELANIGIHVFSGYLTDEECDNLVSNFKVDDYLDDLDISEWTDRLDSRVDSWPEHIKSRMAIDRMKLAQGIYGRPLAMDYPHLVRWPEGSWKDTHSDHGTRGEFTRRDYASVIYLDDEYEGGLLTLPEIDLGIRFDKGTLVIFEGGRMEHGVTQITKGVRHTSPCWFVDKHKWWLEVEGHNPQGPGS